jgi:hypothetical protein
MTLRSRFRRGEELEVCGVSGLEALRFQPFVFAFVIAGKGV